jgi:ribosomal protein S18 acetylase RimI-like enzyme
MDQTTLPKGYTFVWRETIRSEEIMQLRASVGWLPDKPYRWDECIERSLSVVGIRDSSETLVGIGFLAGNLRHAVLCDFCVHPAHRGKGLGKALLDARLEKADELAIPYLYASVSAENTLRKYYEAKGFGGTGGELFRSKQYDGQ